MLMPNLAGFVALLLFVPVLMGLAGCFWEPAVLPAPLNADQKALAFGLLIIPFFLPALAGIALAITGLSLREQRKPLALLTLLLHSTALIMVITLIFLR